MEREQNGLGWLLERAGSRYVAGRLNPACRHGGRSV